MFLFIRREFDQHRDSLEFLSQREGSKSSDFKDEFNAVGLGKELYSNNSVELFLLHPKHRGNNLEFFRFLKHGNAERWGVTNVKQEFYADKNSSIALGIFRK